jgi:hypothetical protein
LEINRDQSSLSHQRRRAGAEFKTEIAAPLKPTMDLYRAQAVRSDLSSAALTMARIPHTSHLMIDLPTHGAGYSSREHHGRPRRRIEQQAQRIARIGRMLRRPTLNQAAISITVHVPWARRSGDAGQSGLHSPRNPLIDIAKNRRRIP